MTQYFTPLLTARSQSSASLQQTSTVIQPVREENSGLLASRASNAGNNSIPIAVVPVGAQVLSAWFTPTASQAGSATNYADVQIVDLGTDGTGTVVVASKTFSAAGTSVASNAPGSFSVVASLASSIAAGHHLAVSYASQGNGIALVAHSVTLAWRNT